MNSLAPNISEEVLAHLANRSLVFVGMMGCGKTAIGRVTASHLGLPFKDADEEIERRSGMSVADYFKQYGEKEFRLREAQVIANILDEEQCLLALGGGAFLSEQTRETIVSSAISIWLKTDLETLYSRVMRKPGKRPLLNNEDPKGTLKNLLKEREPVYAKADLTVQTSKASKIATRNLVIGALHDHLTN